MNWPKARTSASAPKKSLGLPAPTIRLKPVSGASMKTRSVRSRSEYWFSDEIERRIAGRHRIADLHAHRAEGTHAQPNRRAAGAAVVEKGHGPGARICAVDGKRGIENAGGRLALIVLQRNRARTRSIRIRSTAERDRMLCDRIGWRLAPASLSPGAPERHRPERPPQSRTRAYACASAPAYQRSRSS